MLQRFYPKAIISLHEHMDQEGFRTFRASHTQNSAPVSVSATLEKEPSKIHPNELEPAKEVYIQPPQTLPTERTFKFRTSCKKFLRELGFNHAVFNILGKPKSPEMSIKLSKDIKALIGQQNFASAALQIYQSSNKSDLKYNIEVKNGLHNVKIHSNSNSNSDYDFLECQVDCSNIKEAKKVASFLFLECFCKEFVEEHAE